MAIAARMTTTKQYNFLNRLLAISNAPSANSPIAYAYAYNDANQRTRCTMPDGSFWLYEYDNLSQLVSAKRYWADGTPVAAQQFEYAYDDIGNRTSTKQGGDAGGAGLRPAAYSANSLNQYTQRDVPGAADIIGIAHANASVTVNGASPYRKGEYFWKELSINNASAAVWQSVTNIASLTGTNQTNRGNLFLPKTPEMFGYDADGNTTNDGRFRYTWDAENRLTQVESLSSSPTASKRKVVWQYDGQGRRIRQTTYNGGSGSYVVTNDFKFVADSWRHVAELNATNNVLIRSYLWGLDLSGSLDGAGGVGGLVALNSKANGMHFCAYDGNGNLVALADARNGTASARYEHGPFAEPLRSSGSMASENPFRFSTKRTDDTVDLTLYEYRLLRPTTGRWLSRDKLSEEGGIAIYSFVRNNSLSEFDVDGRLSIDFVDKHKGQCGYYIAWWAFHLDDILNWNIDGYFVQKVTASEQIHKCKCGSPAGPIKEERPYYEAWRIGALGRPVPGGEPRADDQFAHTLARPDAGATSASFGGWSWRLKAGELKYFPIGKTLDLEALWGSQVPEAHGLPSTWSEPTWWNDVPLEGPAYHYVYASWNCCYGRRLYQLTISPPDITY